MDFIERLFGVAPDGGSGALEAALLVVPLAAAFVVGLIARRRNLRTAARASAAAR